MPCLLVALILVHPGMAGVHLGSYGRAQVSSDLQGGQGQAVNVVDHGTRLEKDPYLELDVIFDEETNDGATFEAVITPAVSGQPFAYDGAWDADLALRNLYVEAREFSSEPLSVWAGSRMWRGDDVHLQDFWPMDEVNAMGGGLDFRPRGWELGLLVGVNRLSADTFQVQYIEVPDEQALGTESVLFMDRQRLISGARVARLMEKGDTTWRVKAYAEVQALPKGTRMVEDFVEEELPPDWGSVAGLQLSAWGWGHDSFAHLFLVRESGLATLGELGMPTSGLAPDDTVGGATRHLMAFSSNTEGERWGLLSGGYIGRFRDADEAEADPDDRWQAILALRPTLFTSRHTSVGLEVSQQWLRPDGLNPHTREHDVPLITKAALLPAVQVGRGSLARPQIRLQYVFSYLNDDARLWFDTRDERSRSNIQHFLGAGAEWWINSKSYR